MTVFRQIPQRPQTRRAAAEYQRIAFVTSSRRIEQFPVAQQMPQRQPDAVDGNRRFAVESVVSQPRERGRSGKRGGVTEKLTACRHGVGKGSSEKKNENGTALAITLI